MGVPLNYNIRNLVQRKGTTLMTAFGIGLTVAVLVTAVAMTQGLKSVFAGTGDERNVLVLRKGVDAELSSTVSGDAYQIIRRLPGIAVGGDGEPLVSPEAITVINLPSVEAPEGMNVTVRGLLPVGLAMRPLEIVSGKAFAPGLRQVIVGESVARRYPSAQIGQQLKFGRGLWEVVGVFKNGESATNSEIWADLNQVRGDFEQQGGSNSLLVRADISAAEAQRQIDEAARATAAANKAKKDGEPDKTIAPAFISAFGIADDQRLNAAAVGEKKYYADMTSSGAPLQVLGFTVAIIMAVGSAFAATNTMYAAVARRSREIGTLRALGFGRWAILRSFMLESICLALLGGVAGVLLVLPLNNLTTGIGNFATFSETAFKLKVGWPAISFGMGFAALIGAVGGFLPAWSASRKGVVAAMREA
ncbi:MAG TPA: ABC transporter permease [Tepidisphaeraceae bacterium]|jgi:ABC-type antimicrobial peptide transport system permease subunit